MTQKPFLKNSASKLQTDMDLRPLLISLKVGFLATVITFFIGIAAAYFVVQMKKTKGIADAIFTLPMILPPTVTGFFLLLIFGKNSIIGEILNSIGISFVFSWTGAVIASIVVSFPLMYRATCGAFELIDMNIIYAARTLGLSEWKIFYKIMIPVSLPGIIAGTILAFARAMGEFGATIMLAGNIPGKTQTMAIAVYSAVQAGDRTLAFKWVGIICVISFTMIILLNTWLGNQSRFIGK